ncbi:Oxidative stress-induced growth inhibitor 1 [Penicillium rolfsii]|nr:Oxidative stress-induced growth inhibitor 1 [Penicillium rolfsii]
METDTVIVGNGPSAMILSYILHGHIPFYARNPPHPDSLLDSKLNDSPDLLNANVDALTAHFAASRLSYSTQALPVNVLLDTLVRPSVDVDESGNTTNIEWRHVPEKAISHLVFGDAPRPGGQWTEDPHGASWDIQTLSYAAMLSLPGYSFADHHRQTTGQDLPSFTRPTRREIADYFQTYPAAVHVDDVFRCGEQLSGISRTPDGFFIQSHNLKCKRLVLASGIFSEILPPPPVLQPLLQTQLTPTVPLLVIGSGFSAADAIISASPDQKILHVFKWSPEDRPSPLRGCHQQAYPEYAGVYRLMKRAALADTQGGKSQRPKYRRGTSSAFLESRNWEELYEGVSNVEIIAVETKEGLLKVLFRREDGATFSRVAGGLVYAAGRRGTLGYLDSQLRTEVLGHDATDDVSISGQTLRAKALEDMEVAPDVYIIGSLTGDSLVRFAYGGCVATAGHLLGHKESDRESRSMCSSVVSTRPQSSSLQVMNGMDGHHIFPIDGSALTREDTALSKVSTTPTPTTLQSWWKTVVGVWRDLTQ